MGEGITDVTSDDIYAVVVDALGPNEEHLGFRDESTGDVRIAGRRRCIGGTCTTVSDFSNAQESNHATAVTGILLGDLTEGQDPNSTTPQQRFGRSGYATEARAHAMSIGDQAGFVTGLSAIAGGTFSPIGSVASISIGAADPVTLAQTVDPTCSGTAFFITLNLAVDNVFRSGLLPIKAAGNSPATPPNDCTVTAPGATTTAFTVAAYGDATTPDTLAGLRAAGIWANSARGGNATEGSNRAIIDIAAPNCRANGFDTTGGYGYADCGTSFATPQVSAMALDLIDWDKTRGGAQDLLDHNPGLLHAVMLLMGDRQKEDGTRLLSGADNRFGVGRLRARSFTGNGMDEPWYFNYGLTCVGQGESVGLPIAFTPMGDINVFKAAAYWYDLSAGNGLGTLDNINLRLVNDDTEQTIRASNLTTNEYEFLIARGGYSGSDTIANVPLKLVFDGISVLNDSGICSGNRVPVWYAFFFEDSDREESSPTWDSIPNE